MITPLSDSTLLDSLKHSTSNAPSNTPLQSPYPYPRHLAIAMSVGGHHSGFSACDSAWPT